MAGRHARKHPLARFAPTWNRWTSTAATLLLVIAVAGVSPVGEDFAVASTTAVSTFTKTAIDENTGEQATDSQVGKARPGDTLRWVLGYANTTGADANVSITDPITGSQNYVPNSLQAPPTFTSGVANNTVSASGPVLTGTTADRSSTFSVATTTFTTPGGDGYSVEGFGGNIYTVFHHTTSTTTVFCATLANTVCPGWPSFSTYVNPTAGTPLGTGGAGPYRTGGENGSWISNGRLYWPVEGTQATNGRYAVGVQCLDLAALTSCGLTQLDTTSVAGTLGQVSADGIPAADGNYYLFDADGNVLCIDPNGGSCGSPVNISGGRLTSVSNGSGYNGSILTSGSSVYITFVSRANPANHVFMSCFDTATAAACPTFPKDLGASTNAAFPDFLAPVLSTTGAFRGACALLKAVCYSPSGATLTNPWTGITALAYPTAGGFGSGLIRGTRFYAGNGGNGTMLCFDFATWSGSGAVPGCSGFAGPVDSQNYTVRELANLPGCLAANGNAGVIKVFNAQTGGACAAASQSVTLTPGSFYCDGQPGHAASWDTISLPGLTGAEYAGASLTLLGKDGSPVPGWTNVPFPSGAPPTLDISAIPIAGNTATLTAQVSLAAVSNAAAVQASRVKGAWDGDAVQICYETVLPAMPCLTDTSVSNTATAVTTAGAITDAPGGNSSGPVVFDVANPAQACLLHFVKTASKAPAKPGDTVTYTIDVTNTGTADYAGANPASFTDDLSGVLTDATYEEDARASAGTVGYDTGTQVLSWSGPLAAGDSARVTYSVTVHDPDAGGHDMTNAVVSPDPSNCGPSSTDPDCSSGVLISDLRVTKSSDPASGSAVHAGDVIGYTITFTNAGVAAEPVDYTDDLSKVLDDAALIAGPSGSNPGLNVSAVDDNRFTVTGNVPGQTTYTVTYRVRVRLADRRGDNVLDNFVVPTGTQPPASCQQGNPACTTHAVGHLSITKAASTSERPAPGDPVTYTITVANDGALDYTVADRATVTDDLSGVLDDASYNDDARADTGTVNVNGSELTWSGALAAGARVIITYSITYSGDGDTVMVNTACVPRQGTDIRCDSASVPAANVQVTKSVDPRSGTTVVAGGVLTYTLTFENIGEGPGDVDYTDHVGGVLDDATVIDGPTASNGALSVSAIAGGTFTVTGIVPGDTEYTVTLQVRVNPDGHRGDNLLDNFLARTGTTPPDECAAADPLCTHNLIAEIAASKSVDPVSGTVVHAGDALTYTLTFANNGTGPGRLDYTDHLERVLDDATVIDGPTASNDALTVSPVADDEFTVTGDIPPSVSYTVTLRVRVKPDGRRGDSALDNFITPTGTTPAAECTVAEKQCTTNDVAGLVPSKSVDPDSGTAVRAGDVLTYRLTFANLGATAEPVDYVDHVAEVLDDARISAGPTAGNPGLTVSRIANARFHVTGTVPAGATYTVSYQVTVKADGQRGDNRVANFLLPPGQRPPAQCSAAVPLCTVNPVSELVVAKSVDPDSGTRVHDGDKLTYTLTFHNAGQGTVAVDYTDHIAAVLDDATVAAEPTTSAPRLTASKIGSDAFQVSGSLPAGTTVTVTYRVQVKPYAEQGDHDLLNFLNPTGDRQPAACTPGNPLCTRNPVATSPEHGSQGGTASTGADWRAQLTYAGMLIAIGAIVVLVARRRRRA